VDCFVLNYSKFCREADMKSVHAIAKMLAVLDMVIVSPALVDRKKKVSTAAMTALSRRWSGLSLHYAVDGRQSLLVALLYRQNGQRDGMP
jgi:hypothetical protein